MRSLPSCSLSSSFFLGCCWAWDGLVSRRSLRLSVSGRCPQHTAGSSAELAVRSEGVTVSAKAPDTNITVQHLTTLGVEIEVAMLPALLHYWPCTRGSPSGSDMYIRPPASCGNDLQQSSARILHKREEQVAWRVTARTTRNCACGVMQHNAH